MVQLQVSIRFLFPIVTLFFFFTGSLYIITYVCNDVRLVNRNRKVSTVSSVVGHFCFRHEKKHAFCGLLVARIDKRLLLLMNGNDIINITVITCTYLMELNAMRLE